VLTFACATTRRASRLTAIAGAALTVSLLTFASVRQAHAEGVEIESCVGTWHATNCVTRSAPAGDAFIRTVPQPRDGAERSRAIEEDRLWVERCRPTIHPDRYGVARYHYTRPGCEFGITSY
jgi:hypothetical protein